MINKGQIAELLQALSQQLECPTQITDPMEIYRQGVVDAVCRLAPMIVLPGTESSQSFDPSRN